MRSKIDKSNSDTQVPIPQSYLYSFLIVIFAVYYYLNQKFIVVNYLWFAKVIVASIILTAITTAFVVKKKKLKSNLFNLIFVLLLSWILLVYISLLSFFLLKVKNKNNTKYESEILGYSQKFDQVTFRFNGEKFTKIRSIRGEFDRKKRLFFKNFILISKLEKVNQDIYYIHDFKLIKKEP